MKASVEPRHVSPRRPANCRLDPARPGRRHLRARLQSQPANGTIQTRCWFLLPITCLESPLNLAVEHARGAPVPTPHGLFVLPRASSPRALPPARHADDVNPREDAAEDLPGRQCMQASSRTRMRNTCTKTFGNPGNHLCLRNYAHEARGFAARRIADFNYQKYWRFAGSQATRP